MSVNYDEVAGEYENYRTPDPRIEKAIKQHLKTSRKILNVGAGRGAYEPTDMEVVAVEPSAGMIAARPAERPPAIHGYAESLPFEDKEFDASMAILTIHHWHDLEAGLREMKRVTRGKVILFTWDGTYDEFWPADYFPEINIDETLFPSISKLQALLGDIEVEAIEIPHDCTDGFMCAYWRRPEMYLDAGARQAISTFSRIIHVEAGLRRLEADLKSGEWEQKYGQILKEETLDCGYKLVVHDTRIDSV